MINKTKSKKAFLLFLIILFFCSAVLFPKLLISGAIKGINYSINSVIPSLFPFFVATNILINSSITIKLSGYLKKMMKFLFNMSQNCATPYVIGLISGFPIAADCTAKLYLRGDISKKEAEILLAIVNNASFAFVSGVIGGSIFNDFSIGIFLYFVQLVSSLIVGIIFGKLKLTQLKTKKIQIKINGDISTIIVSSVKSATISIGYVCGFIIFFCAITELLPLHTPPILIGLIEMTTGVMGFSSAPINLSNVLQVFIITSFSGICVFMQVQAMLQKTNLSLRYFFLGKIITPLIGGAIIVILFSFI